MCMKRKRDGVGKSVKGRKVYHNRKFKSRWLNGRTTNSGDRNVEVTVRCQEQLSVRDMTSNCIMAYQHPLMSLFATRLMHALYFLH